MSENIRIGIVGAGRNTRTMHIPGLRALDGVEIVSVCNRSRESSAQVAEQFNIPRIYDDWRALVAADDTDAIIIGTWPYLHQPITLAALAAGKHVMCEARMARNAREAHEMAVAAAARPDLVAQIVPAPFSFGVDKTIKRLIGEGFLGDILAVEVADRRGFLDTDGALNWRRDRDLSGHNIMTLGIWYETLLRWVGPATQVMAMGQTFVKMRSDTATGQLRPVQIPEHLDVVAALACGAQAHIGISQVTGLVKMFEASLFGSDGTLCYRDNKLFGGRRGQETLTEIEVPPAEQGHWRVEEEFVNAIRGQEPISHTTFADGVKYMEFTEAVGRSMAENRSIALPLV